MIRINLLIERKAKEKKIPLPGRFPLLVLGCIIASIVVMGIVTVYFKAKIAGLESQREVNKATISQLAKKITEVKRYEQLNKEYDKKNTLIETLRKNQSVPVRLLENVSALTPEGVWLTALTYRDPTVSLEGYAFSNIDLVAYVDNLKKTSSISDVYLQESRQTEIEKVSVYKFNLNFKVKV